MALDTQLLVEMYAEPPHALPRSSPPPILSPDEQFLLAVHCGVLAANNNYPAHRQLIMLCSAALHANHLWHADKQGLAVRRRLIDSKCTDDEVWFRFAIERPKRAERAKPLEPRPTESPRPPEPSELPEFPA